MEISTRDLDAPSTETLQQICEAIRSSGQFFFDPQQDSIIVTSTQKDGTLTARRLGSSSPFGTAVLDRGIIRLLQESRNGDIPAPRFYWGPYEKMLTRLPTSYADILDLPTALGLYALPAVVEDAGKLIQGWSGLHPNSSLLFTGTALPQAALDRVDRSYPLLREWLSAIEFTHDVYRGNLLGFVVACLARPICPQFPFLILDATDKKQGKTTVAEAVVALLRGEHARPITHTGDEHELEKRLSGFCGRPGPNVIFIDNVRPKRGQSGVIRSQFFAVAATSPCASVRPPYGRKAEPIDYPIVMLTMNEASVESDLHDRAIRVVLTGKSGRYFTPHPVVYAREHRTELLAEAIHLLTTECQDALTGDFLPKSRFGSWERIATAAAAALKLPYNFDPDAVDTSDALVRELFAVYHEMQAEQKRQPTFPELAGRVRMSPENLPELAGLLRRSNATTDVTQGNILKKHVEKLIGRDLFLDARRLQIAIDTNDRGVKTLRMET